jgi:fructose-specific phosphotransferase system IIC component
MSERKENIGLLVLCIFAMLVSNQIQYYQSYGLYGILAGFLIGIMIGAIYRAYVDWSNEKLME